MDPVVSIIGGVAIAVVSGIVALAVKNRETRSQEHIEEMRTSGDIERTEPAKLWEAAETIRKELREDLVHERDARVTQEQAFRAELARQDADCDRRLAAMEEKVETMKAQLRKAGDA